MSKTIESGSPLNAVGLESSPRGNQLILPPSGKLVHPNLLVQGKGFWQKKVIWDLHGVLVDWMTPFCNFVNKVYGRNIDHSMLTTYHWGYDGNMHLNPTEFYEMFRHFAGLAKGGYGDLQPYPGAVDAMHKIHLAGIEQEIHTWTPGASDIADSHGQPFHTCPAQGVTLALIERLGLPVDLRPGSGGVQFKHSWRKAKEMADEHVPLLIEDSGPTVAAAVQDFGIGAIICTQSYNRSLSEDRVIRWGDPEHPELQSRTGIEEPIIQFFKELEEAELLIGSEK